MGSVAAPRRGLGSDASVLAAMSRYLLYFLGPDTIPVFLRVLRMGHVEIVGRFARLATIECIYRGETGFGFSCGHSENPKPVSPRNLG